MKKKTHKTRTIINVHPSFKDFFRLESHKIRHTIEMKNINQDYFHIKIKMKKKEKKKNCTRKKNRFLSFV